MVSTPSPAGNETMPPSPSSSGAQNAKAKRYDRQLRLWGDHGQNSLEKSKVCLIGATATATEILKSLVLPGVGRFTIVDGKKVTAEDIGNNFFLERDSIGMSRGAIATNLLSELNPEVRGVPVDDSPETVLNNNPDFFDDFDLVIATEIGEKTLATLSKKLWNANIPMMIVKSYGLLGYIRLQVREHAVVESHPDNVLEDLRLDSPFDSLLDFLKEQNFETMSKNEYMHTPYLIILFKYLEMWRSQNDGKIPQNYKEKREFKDMILKKMKNREDVKHEDLENFEEAIKAANTALQPSRVPESTKQILDDAKCLSLNNDSEDFWIIARSLKDFIDQHGVLPLKGSLPDMFSDSERYIKLLNIYHSKSALDAEQVYRKVQTHLESIGRSPESISEASVKKFCKEAANLRLHRDSGSIADEMDGRISPSKNDLISVLEQNSESEAAYYLILRGVDRFQRDFNVLPGEDDDHIEPDIGRLKSCVSQVLNECFPGISSSVIKDDFVHEVCRFGGSEPHALAAFIGGCAAHEAIKLLTKQYVPIDNLFLFNAMNLNSISLKIA